MNEYAETPSGGGGVKEAMKQKVNSEQLAIQSGDLIEVMRDDGTKELRKATSEPWEVCRGVWIVKLEGISGGYDLSRCTRVEAYRAMFS